MIKLNIGVSPIWNLIKSNNHHEILFFMSCDVLYYLDGKIISEYGENGVHIESAD